MKNNAIKNRYEFVMFFDVENGNPNGDPDAGNMPRTDPETSFGIVTDVCLKRKIRNFVELYKDGDSGYNILVKADRSLNSKFTEAYDALKLEKGKKGKNTDDVKKAQEYICANYFDVRTFGAVMSTGNDPCGIVRGPVQINFAKSIDPVYVQDITVTRQAVTTEKDFTEKKQSEMGKKSFISYGLYRAEGYVSAMLAQKVTGFSEEDLELLWTSIINMFENDRSASRGKMCLRKLYIFKHESALGNAPAHILFDKIKVEKKEECEIPRKFEDYTITVDNNMPSGVEFIEKL
ncbi:MAG: type I-C CRISPR-associated protein Cas7/Csd2 [Ruminococcus sp.]|nr:type I-C CRISPR-associated protein Cas7/Csd2 [Ruminococcus sp.]